VGRSCAFEGSINLRYVLDVVRFFGVKENYVLTGPRGESVIGMPRSRLVERVRHSAFLLNIMGYLRDEEVLGRASKRVFLDIDPGFGQMWNELGLHHPFSGYEAYVTIGLNIGRADCAIPTCGLDWIVTPQTVVLEWWPPSDVPGESFTTIASWRGAYGPVEFHGESYGLRVHQFRRFVDLPELTGRPFELALAIHPSETRDLALLSDKGWPLVDPQMVAGDLINLGSVAGTATGGLLVDRFNPRVAPPALFLVGALGVGSLGFITGSVTLLGVFALLSASSWVRHAPVCSASPSRSIPARCVRRESAG
jgi:hypothetical protein